jgi:hypothetical protein
MRIPISSQHFPIATEENLGKSYAIYGFRTDIRNRDPLNMNLKRSPSVREQINPFPAKFNHVHTLILAVS